MSKPRLFVALELPDSFLRDLDAWRRSVFGSLKDARLLPKRNLHVTLVFLGYRDERDLSRLIEVLDSVEGRPLELSAQRLVTIGGSRRRGRALAIELADPRGELADYQRSLSSALEAAGLYEPEQRPYWPHLTFARGKSKSRLTLPEGVSEDLPAELCRSFTAERVVLFQSILHPAGARYEAVAEKALN